MRTASISAASRMRLGDVLLGGLLLAVFVLGYLEAQGWPFRARMFPEMVCTAGAVFALLELVALAVRARRRDSAPAADPVHADQNAARNGTTRESADDDEDVDDQSLEYVFGTAGRGAWTRAVAWVAGFFISLWLLGVFVTVPVFSFAYLRVAGQVGWRASAVYAAVAGGLIWLVFGRLLLVPMPAGIFGA